MTEGVGEGWVGVAAGEGVDAGAGWGAGVSVRVRVCVRDHRRDCCITGHPNRPPTAHHHPSPPHTHTPTHPPNHHSQHVDLVEEVDRVDRNPLVEVLPLPGKRGEGKGQCRGGTV